MGVSSNDFNNKIAFNVIDPRYAVDSRKSSALMLYFGCNLNRIKGLNHKECKLRCSQYIYSRCWKIELITANASIVI